MSITSSIVSLLLRLAIRNMFARRTRSILTILAIVYSVSLLVALETVTYGFKQVLSSEVQELLPTDLLVYSSSISIPQPAVSVISRLDYVSHVTPAILTSNVLINGEPATLVGIPLEDISYFQAQMIEGNLPSGDGEAIIQSNLARKLGIRVGDELSIQVLESIQGTYRTINVRVTGIFSTILGGFLGFQLNMVVLPLDQVQNDLGDEGFINALFIKLTEQNTPALNQLVTSINRLFPNAEIYEQQSILGAISRTISLINTFFVVLITISLLVTGLTVANTMMMNIRERIREIGIMKAIGITNKQLVLMFTIEVLIMAIVGSLIGIVVGYLGSHGVSMALRSMGLSIRIPIEALPDLYLLSTAAAVATALLASLIPLRGIAKVRPMEVLRIE